MTDALTDKGRDYYRDKLVVVTGGAGSNLVIGAVSWLPPCVSRPPLKASSQSN